MFLRRSIIPYLFITAVIILAGCTKPLHIRYMPGEVPPEAKAKKPLTILIKPYIDERGDAGPRYVGKITVPMSDMYKSELLLDREVSVFVTDAVKEHLTSAGFKVREWMPGEEEGDNALIMSGRIKEFRLDIGPRDAVQMEIESTLKKGTGKVIWMDTEKIRDDRYAGVMGDSRRTVSLYLTRTLAKVLNRTFADLNREMELKAKRRVVPLPSRVEKEGIEVRRHEEGKGRLSLKTAPPRARVYVDDVYYGLTPLISKMKPGIYSLSIRLKGYKEIKEKVSIRRNETTELDREMERR